LVALSACAVSSGGSEFFALGCGADAARHLEGVDWEQAKQVKIRIRQDNFTPTYMGLHQGVAYRLTLENADDGRHVFRASEFFTSIALAGVSVDGGEEDEDPCIDAISLGGGETALARFVAFRDGVYEFDDNSVMLAMALGGSAGGFISIEPAPDIPVSPVDHLKLIEPPEIMKKSLEPTRPTSLFGDQPTPPSGAPPGLFDDQPTPPSGAPSGLFDDQAPPAEAPTSLFDLPASDQPPAQPIEAAPSIPVEPEQGAPSGEGLFGEPAPEEPPLVEALPGEPPPETDTVMGLPADEQPPMHLPPTGMLPSELQPELPAPESLAPPPSDAAPHAFSTMDAMGGGPPADFYSDPPDPAVGAPGGGGGNDDTLGHIG